MRKYGTKHRSRNLRFLVTLPGPPAEHRRPLPPLAGGHLVFELAHLFGEAQHQLRIVVELGHEASRGRRDGLRLRDGPGIGEALGVISNPIGLRNPPEQTHAEGGGNPRAGQHDFGHGQRLRWDVFQAHGQREAHRFVRSLQHAHAFAHPALPNPEGAGELGEDHVGARVR